jgi:formylglycine-generating enzyme required for sulfatase activity
MKKLLPARFDKKTVLSIVAAVLFPFSLAAAPDGAIAKLRDSMVMVEGGAFLQGSAEAPYTSTERVHASTVSSFLIASVETTQALWREVMASNPSKFKGDDRPVESVSWLDAVKFCNALSEREGLQKAYAIEGSKVEWVREADGYRLPSEAEWEFAARGGRFGALSDAPLKKAPYSGGSVASEVAWFDQNSGKASQPVAKKAPNELGLYDMSGNVWEWCWDWYGEYPRATVEDYAGIDPGNGVRVMRGGAWFTPMNLLRVTYRYWNAPTFKVNSVGFRVARNAGPFGLETQADVGFFQALSAPESELPR